jgi:hypothetical protein
VHPEFVTAIAGIDGAAFVARTSSARTVGVLQPSSAVADAITTPALDSVQRTDGPVCP